jgi:hypothetical protein
MPMNLVGPVGGDRDVEGDEAEGPWSSGRCCCLPVLDVEREEPVPLGASYIVKTIRLLAIEDQIFDLACGALGGLERAQLMQEAVLIEACRLGLAFSSRPPPPLKAPWPYLPERGAEPTAARVSISLPVTIAELMSIAAGHVKATEPLFIVGSTLGYIGRLQRCYRGLHAMSSREARKVRGALGRIKLPHRYCDDGPAHQSPASGVGDLTERGGMVAAGASGV